MAQQGKLIVALVLLVLVLGKINCSNCSNTGKLNHSTCDGTGSIKTSNKCEHEYNPDSDHFWCSNHGNSVSEYH